MNNRPTARDALLRLSSKAPGRHQVRTLSAVAGLALVAGALAGAPATSAGYSDRANVNLGTGTDASGIGFPHTFGIAVAMPDGTFEQADDPDGCDWVVEGADTLVPGHEIVTTIPVFNNTPTLDADTRVEIVLRNGDGQVGPDIPNITELLRFTAAKADGTVLFADVLWQDAKASIGVLAARGANALAQGEPYSAGPAGNAEEVTLTIRYPDGSGVDAYNGGQSALSVRFAATSVKP